MGNNNSVLVSVCMITYNHALYISRAIEGVISQKNIDFELIIGDDCSQDSTLQICETYKNQYPHLIRLFSTPANIGFMRNFEETLGKSVGKYIAICEGDDYWTDPLKLSKQIKFLEENSDHGLVYSSALIYNYKKEKILRNRLGSEVGNKGLVYSNPVPTLTAVFRKDLYERYLSEVNPTGRNWKMADYPCWLWFYFNSKMYYIPEVTGVYNLLEESASHTNDRNKRYLYNLNSFEISDFYALKYFDEHEYNRFLEYRNLFLYLYCVKNKIDAKQIWIDKLKSINKPRFVTRLIILIFNKMKLDLFITFLFSKFRND